MSIYDIPVRKSDGNETTLAEYRGKVMLIVNVASKCSFTKQYAGIEALYEKYKDRGLVVLGFPCNQFMGQEPGDDVSIQQFCSLTYKVKFPIFAKVEVNGKNTHPLYAFLKRERRGMLWTLFVKWNFTKFLVDREGNVVKRIGTATKPAAMEKMIEKLLG